jgi:hypothetical protein
MKTEAVHSICKPEGHILPFKHKCKKEIPDDQENILGWILLYFVECFNTLYTNKEVVAH